MSFLTVRHSTVYRYGEPVGLGEHRMLFRPRESYDLRLIRTSLIITPQPAHFRWLHDPFDNTVAVATFEGTTTELRFQRTVTLEHFETSMPEYPLEDYARTYPFRYSDEDFPNLVRGLAPHYQSESVSVRRLLERVSSACYPALSASNSQEPLLYANSGVTTWPATN